MTTVLESKFTVNQLSVSLHKPNNKRNTPQLSSVPNRNPINLLITHMKPEQLPTGSPVTGFEAVGCLGRETDVGRRKTGKRGAAGDGGDAGERGAVGDWSAVGGRGVVGVDGVAGDAAGRAHSQGFWYAGLVCAKLHANPGR